MDGEGMDQSLAMGSEGLDQSLATGSEGMEQSLASMWEKDQDVRFFLRREGALIRWPKPSQMGVVNLACLGLNHRVMSIVADWHCPHALKCKSPPVALIKAQVGRSANLGIGVQFHEV